LDQELKKGRSKDEFIWEFSESFGSTTTVLSTVYNKPKKRYHNLYHEWKKTGTFTKKYLYRRPKPKDTNKPQKHYHRRILPSSQAEPVSEPHEDRARMEGISESSRDYIDRTQHIEYRGKEDIEKRTEE